jgi:hypothetical protein
VRAGRDSIGSENFQPASIANPPMIITAPPMENTRACWPDTTRLSALAPRATGRITVPTPAAKTSVMPTIRERRWKVEAK